MKLKLFLVIFLFLILGAIGWKFQDQIRGFWHEYKNGPVPVEKPVADVQAAPYVKLVEEPLVITPKQEPQENSALNKETAKAKEINLPVPFTSQAPHGNWELPYQEACEEASLIMAAAYVKGTPLVDKSWTPDQAEAEILKLVEWENKTLGYYKDTTAEEVARTAREYFAVAATVFENPNAEDIRNFLRAGKLVIAPFYGHALDNSNFTGQGPLYHMLVIKGFTSDGRFVTNDPGTRNGRNFTYSEENLMGALHDWNGGDVQNGAKRVVVIGRQ